MDFRSYVEADGLLIPEYGTSELSACYTQASLGNYQHLRYPAMRIHLSNGCISISRNYLEPDSATQGIIANILNTLARGECGELSWDLLDGDYIYFEATGGDLQSLRDYLDPTTAPETLRAQWNIQLEQQQIDASPAQSWEEVLNCIAAHFGIAVENESSVASVYRWISITQSSNLPRKLLVEIKNSIYEASQDEQSRLIQLNPRILWSWRMHY